METLSLDAHEVRIYLHYLEVKSTMYGHVEGTPCSLCNDPTKAWNIRIRSRVYCIECIEATVNNIEKRLKGALRAHVH